MARGISKVFLQRVLYGSTFTKSQGNFSSASPTALIMSEHPLPGTNHLRSLKTSIPWGKLCWEGTASSTWRDQNRQGKCQLVGKRSKNNWRKGQFPGTGHPALCHPGCPSLSSP